MAWRPVHGKTLVAVIWRDAHGSATEVHTVADLDHKPMMMTTYGCLLLHDKVGISVANEWCGKDEWRGVTFVPAELIESVEQLLPASRRSRTPPRVCSVEASGPQTGTADVLRSTTPDQ